MVVGIGMPWVLALSGVCEGSGRLGTSTGQ